MFFSLDDNAIIESLIKSAKKKESAKISSLNAVDIRNNSRLISPEQTTQELGRNSPS